MLERQLSLRDDRVGERLNMRVQQLPGAAINLRIVEPLQQQKVGVATHLGQEGRERKALIEQPSKRRRRLIGRDSQFNEAGSGRLRLVARGSDRGMKIGAEALGKELAAMMGAFYGPTAALPAVLLGLLILYFAR